jgi:hypothetical protein
MVRTTRRSTQSKKTKIELIFKLGDGKRLEEEDYTRVLDLDFKVSSRSSI